MSKNRLILRVFCALFLMLAPIAGRADTLFFASATGGNSGGLDIYPYNFNVNGSSTLTTLACLNSNREVTFGEQWEVNAQGLDMSSSQTAINYRADAVLFSQFGQPGLSNSDVQYAIWSIFDPNIKGNSAFTPTSQMLADSALQAAIDPALVNSTFFQGFVLYTPTSNQTGWSAGIPQEFLGAAAVTPEPSGIALLGTGLLCTGLIWFQKKSSLAMLA